MKKKKVYGLLLVICLSIVMVACNGTGDKLSKEDGSIENSSEVNAEISTIKLAYNPISGHVFHAIAEDQGFYEDEGIMVETVEAVATSDAFQALAAGQIHIASTYGTSTPLQRIADGQNVKVFGGYMITGAMPIFAREGTGWNGVEDWLGKKVVGNIAAYYATGPLLDMGYDPKNDIEWVDIPGFVDKLEAVRSGEADYSTGTTGIGVVGEKMGLEIVAYASDLLADYSCCRVVGNGDWFSENQEDVKRLFKAWLRSQEYYENNREYVVQLMLKQIDSTQEQIESYIFDSHYNLNLDPNKKAVVRAWDYMERLGLMSDGIDLNDLEENFDSLTYKAALDECIKEYYDENPKFYDKQLKLYEESNTKTVHEYLEELKEEQGV